MKCLLDFSTYKGYNLILHFHLGSKSFVFHWIANQFRFNIHVPQQCFHLYFFWVGAVLFKFFVQVLQSLLRSQQPLTNQLIQLFGIMLDNWYHHLKWVKHFKNKYINLHVYTEIYFGPMKLHHFQFSNHVFFCFDPLFQFIQFHNLKQTNRLFCLDTSRDKARQQHTCVVNLSFLIYFQDYYLSHLMMCENFKLIKLIMVIISNNNDKNNHNK